MAEYHEDFPEIPQQKCEIRSEIIWEGEKQRIIDTLQYHIDFIDEVDNQLAAPEFPRWSDEMLDIKEELENLIRIIKASQ